MERKIKKGKRKPTKEEVKIIKDAYETPAALYNLLNYEFNFTLDPCASKHNAKTRRYFSKKDNGLVKNWTGRAFVNPPYSNIGPWLAKAKGEVEAGRCELAVCLVPSVADTARYFNSARFAHEIRRLVGRVHFEHTTFLLSSPRFGCDIVVFRSGSKRKEPKQFFWEWKKHI